MWQKAVAALILAALLRAQHEPPSYPFPLPERSGPLKHALDLLREGKTAEARQELEEQRRQRPDDVEVRYQIARSHLMDFYQQAKPEQRRISLSLAVEMLDSVLQRNPDYIP